MKQIYIAMIFCFILAIVIHAQDGVEVSCGDILENEFDAAGRSQTYSLNIDAGSSFEINIAALGQNTTFVGAIFDPADLLINRVTEADSNISLDSGIISATGQYVIQVTNSEDTLGVYTIFVSCTLRDGTNIEPGESIDLVITPATSTEAPVFGFSELRNIDILNAIIIPFVFETEQVGTLPAQGKIILGFSFEGQRDEQVVFIFEKLSGENDIGLVVVSEANDVLFLTVLAFSDRTTSRFQLPQSGDYYFLVFNSDLNSESENSTPTSFNIFASKID